MLQFKLLKLMTVLVSFLTACGGSKIDAADAADMALNTITDTAQPTYELVRDFCSSAQWTIVHDSNRTISQKKAAVSKVRSKCHEIYNIYEEIIKRQKEIRTVIEASRRGSADVFKALNQINEMQKLIALATSLFAGLKDL